MQKPTINHNPGGHSKLNLVRRRADASMLSASWRLSKSARSHSNRSHIHHSSWFKTEPILNVHSSSTVNGRRQFVFTSHQLRTCRTYDFINRPLLRTNRSRSKDLSTTTDVHKATKATNCFPPHTNRGPIGLTIASHSLWCRRSNKSRLKDSTTASVHPKVFRLYTFVYKDTWARPEIPMNPLMQLHPN